MEIFEAAAAENNGCRDELSLSSADLRNIFDSVQEAIFIHDEQGRLLDVNNRVLQLYQVSREQALAFSIAEDYSGADNPFEQLPEYWQRVCQGEAVQFEWLARRPHDGSCFWVDVALRRVMLSGNARILATVRDISDHKAAAAQLQDYANGQKLLNQITTQIRNSLNLSTILDTAIAKIHDFIEADFCGFAWLDLSVTPTVWNLVTESVSPDVPSIVGVYSGDQVGPVEVPLLAAGVLVINDVANYEEPLHREFLQQQGTESSLLVAVRTEAGELGAIICGTRDRQHLWEASEVELVRAVADQLAIAIDQAQLYAHSRNQAHQLAQALTDLRNTQLQIIQTEKMSSLGQMVAGVAHEINNPVNFIHANVRPALSYATDLLALVRLYQQSFPTVPGAIAEKIEEIDLAFLQQDFLRLLESMQVGTQRIREIVLSLRNFSRLDEAEFKAVDLHDGINSTLIILAHKLKRGQSQEPVEVIQRYGSLPPVECYPSQLNQVFMNILANAIDAMEQVVQPRITITTAARDGWVKITIADNGPGIPASIQAQIFDPFFTTKPVGKGTGMGLSVSYQIVTERHGGQLSVISSAQGTTFEIAIPLRQS